MIGADLVSGILYNSRKGGYHQNHVNTVYDVLENRYIDVLIQPRGEANETSALCEMVRRNPVRGECLYIMDRGFNCFNLMASIREAGSFFMIRAKDVGKGSTLDCFELPDKEEFDTRFTFYISKKKKGVRNPGSNISIPLRSALTTWDRGSPGTSTPSRSALSKSGWRRGITNT